ncbi:hypothetical protein ES703_105056 [subsurface metagenome]
MRLKGRHKTKSHLQNEVGVIRIVIRLLDMKQKQKVSKSFTIYDASVNQVFKICHEAIEKHSVGS